LQLRKGALTKKKGKKKKITRKKGRDDTTQSCDILKETGSRLVSDGGRGDSNGGKQKKKKKREKHGRQKEDIYGNAPGKRDHTETKE